jgi:hypothetical protein
MQENSWKKDYITEMTNKRLARSMMIRLGGESCGTTMV